MSAPPDGESENRYWRKNLGHLAILLSIWFAASFGCGILFADELDRFRVAGFPLGFWFAQQGSIYIFVALVFVYVWLMNRLDREFGDAAIRKEEPARNSFQELQ